MRTTSRQDEAFIKAVISPQLLEEAISWIQDNISPEEVFADAQLAAWAESNGFIKNGAS
jgi:hypothetical protein